ncbi:MAG: FRG domain-containing protein [Thermodesulfobacteriota bacterium]
MGKPSTTSYVQQFAQEYDLSEALYHAEDGSTWLDAAEPATLASFVAFCKGGGVYLRGQNCWRGTLPPSLFRGAASHDDRAARWAAYCAFVKKLKKLLKGTRFKRRNFGAVLQHYGFRTPWLDVLDDIHAAVWFALHTCCDLDGALHYRRIAAPFGYVLVLAVSKEVCVEDLRLGQSSRNTRCHVQQGFSLAMQADAAAAPNQNQDFGGRVVGMVRIPNCEHWHLHGFRASQSYLFPSTEIDNTYKQLLAPQVADLAEKAELQYRVAIGTLGRLAKYSEEDDGPSI